MVYKTRALTMTIIVAFLTLNLSPALLGQEDPIKVTSINKVIEEESITFRVTLMNHGPGLLGNFKIGSESTGYRSLEVYIEEDSEETYELRGIPLPEEETDFKISLTHNEVNLIEPKYVEVTTTEQNYREEKYFSIEGITKNILVLAGIIILTIVGIILITPFLYQPGGNKPFEGDIDLEEIKKNN